MGNLVEIEIELRGELIRDALEKIQLTMLS